MTWPLQTNLIVTTSMDGASDVPPRAEILKMAQHVNKYVGSLLIIDDSFSLPSRISTALDHALIVRDFAEGDHVISSGSTITIPAGVRVSALTAAKLVASSTGTSTINIGENSIVENLTLERQVIFLSSGSVLRNCRLINCAVVVSEGAVGAQIVGNRISGYAPAVQAVIRVNTGGGYHRVSDNVITGVGPISGGLSNYAMVIGEAVASPASMAVVVAGNTIETRAHGIHVNRSAVGCAIAANSIRAAALNAASPLTIDGTRCVASANAIDAASTDPRIVLGVFSVACRVAQGGPVPIVDNGTGNMISVTA